MVRTTPRLCYWPVVGEGVKWVSGLLLSIWSYSTPEYRPEKRTHKPEEILIQCWALSSRHFEGTTLLSLATPSQASVLFVWATGRTRSHPCQMCKQTQDATLTRELSGAAENLGQEHVHCIQSLILTWHYIICKRSERAKGQSEEAGEDRMPSFI